MRVLVCPTAFKESLGAAAAARAMADGVRDVRPDWVTTEVPLSDGGPGLLDALSAARSAGGPPRIEAVSVSGPLREPAEARVLWVSAEEAAVESADACGLHLVGDRRAPLQADTRGVGELLASVLEVGASTLHVGLGGSASTDGGTGLARVFGWRFLDAAGRELPPGGGALRRLGRIDPGRTPSARITALADVRTPLLGMRGAARTFGPQKGADRDEVEQLVVGLEKLAEGIARDLGPEAASLVAAPGSGAAGGLGAGLAVFLGAHLVPGADWVLERVGFEARLAETDAVLTGEGAWDRSSAVGKITGEVLARTAARGVPAVLVCGRLDSDPPAGVTGLDGGGEWLDAEGLRRLAARAARSLQEPAGEA